MIFEVEVIDKSDSRLYVTLIELLSYCYNGSQLPDSKYEVEDFEELILQQEDIVESFRNIHKYQFKGQIKQYEVIDWV